MKIVFSIFLMLASVGAQAGPRIIGDNDFIVVNQELSNIPEVYRNLMPAIGKLEAGCTVTHIGEGFVITAGHCFWQTFFDTQLHLNQPCTDEKITWQTTDQTSQCLEIVAMQRDPELAQDFAIMKISNPPTVAIQVDWNSTSDAGKALTIFSYPKGDPLSWSQYCPLKELSPQDTNLKYMHYTCDTEIGSSGAVVLDAKSGMILGLHISGDGEFSEVATENYGIFISQTPIKTILERNGFL